MFARPPRSKSFAWQAFAAPVCNSADSSLALEPRPLDRSTGPGPQYKNERDSAYEKATPIAHATVATSAITWMRINHISAMNSAFSSMADGSLGSSALASVLGRSRRGRLVPIRVIFMIRAYSARAATYASAIAAAAIVK